MRIEVQCVLLSGAVRKESAIYSNSSVFAEQKVQKLLRSSGLVGVIIFSFIMTNHNKHMYFYRVKLCYN